MGTLRSPFVYFQTGLLKSIEVGSLSTREKETGFTNQRERDGCHQREGQFSPTTERISVQHHDTRKEDVCEQGLSDEHLSARTFPD